jgi:hypothetical protein
VLLLSDAERLDLRMTRSRARGATSSAPLGALVGALVGRSGYTRTSGLEPQSNVLDVPAISPGGDSMFNTRTGIIAASALGSLSEHERWFTVIRRETSGGTER